MNKKAVVAPLLILAIGAAYIWYSYGDGADALNGKLGGSGTIESVELNLGSQIASRVESIKANESDKVKRGDTIVVLDDRLLKEQVAAASAGVEAAEAAVDDADTSSERKIAQAQLKQAQAALSAAKIQQSYSVIKSPIDGQVLSVPYSVGEVVSPGSTVAVVGKNDELDLTIYVDEKELGNIKTGQRAKISVDAYPNETFEGKVIEISSEAEFTPQNVQTKEQRTNLVFAVKIRIENKDGKLKAGMPADAVIED